MLETYDIDLVLGCETFLKSDIENSELMPDSYQVFRKDRNDGYGGVIIIAKQNLIVKELPTPDNVEFIAVQIEVQGNNSPLIVGSLYRPPKSDLQYTELLCSTVSKLSIDKPSSALWVGGDMNLPDISWESLSIDGRQYSKAINQSFLDSLENNNLEQIVNFPTRKLNTLDILATNRPSLVNFCRPIPGLSDHDSIVYTNIDCIAKKIKPIKRKLYIWKKADINEIRIHVRNEITNFVSTYSINTDVEHLWSSFKGIIEETKRTLLPCKFSSTRYSQAWVTTPCRRLIRRKQRAYNKARRTCLASDWEQFRRLKYDSQRECRKAYQNFVHETICPELKNNPKKFWSFIKNKKCDNNGVAPLLSNGVTHIDNRVKANILNKQFSSVFSTPDAIPFVLEPSKFPSVGSIDIDVNGVSKLLHKLKPGKASGSDDIQSRFLKETADELAPALTIIFQASINQMCIPDDWRHANVVPIYKKGDRSLASNYRPVSLTSICSKVLEHIVHSHIISHLEFHDILSDYQHGFRKRRSCESQLIMTINDLAKGLDGGKQIDAILLDFSKAFDKVSHKKLIAKLDFYGVRGNILMWIADFLRNRSQTVVLHGIKSDPVNVSSGVPQGTVLGPLLFLVYINDLPDGLSATPRLFADDCLLYRIIESTNDAQSLQHDLDILQEWERKWSMEFNSDKCEVLRITKKRSGIVYPYRIHGNPLRVVSSAKYLGVRIHGKLLWQPHIDQICKKANSTRAFLQRNLRGCPREVKEQCYKTFIRPVLEYASTAWDPHTHRSQNNVNRLEAVQNRCVRFVCNDWRRDSSVSHMRNSLDWNTLQERRARMRVTMLYNIINRHIQIPVSLVTPSSSPYNTRGSGIKFLVPHCNTNVYLNSFFPSTVVSWNLLPCSVTSATTVDAFKNRLQSVCLGR